MKNNPVRWGIQYRGEWCKGCSYSDPDLKIELHNSRVEAEKRIRDFWSGWSKTDYKAVKYVERE